MKKAVCNLAIEAVVVNQGGAMEADTISKNGRSSKSQTSRGNILGKCIGIIAFVLCFAMSNIFAQNHKPIYAGLELGSSFIGGTGVLFGVKGAYFFNEKIGLGFAVRNGTKLALLETIGDAVFGDGDENVYYKRTFVGPVFYGHWGNSSKKLYFPMAAGIGGIITEQNSLPIAIYFSQGIAYKIADMCSVGTYLNLGGGLLFTLSLGVNFHF